MNSQDNADPLIFCPTCGRKMTWNPDNQYRPFCTERCKLVDLGQWATERYRLAGEAVEEAAAGHKPSD